MNHITFESAQQALDNLYDTDFHTLNQLAAYETLSEFIMQMNHFMRTREIMVPILLQPKKE